MPFILTPKQIQDFDRFCASRYAYYLFTDDIYRWLSHLFHHIAHYDKSGFYREWFERSPTCGECGRKKDLADLRWETYVFAFSEPNDAEKRVQQIVRFHTTTPAATSATPENTKDAV